jgi:hypothetical protein
LSSSIQDMKALLSKMIKLPRLGFAKDPRRPELIHSIRTNQHPP